jgi:hypothetical protein
MTNTIFAAIFVALAVARPGLAQSPATPPATPPPTSSATPPATTPADSVGGAKTARGAHTHTRKPAHLHAAHTAAGLSDSALAARWPVKGPEPLPGAVLPHYRIVAYYGNPMSRRMGILGQIAPDSMLARLQREVRAYAAADTATPVMPALELIVTVAQAGPGADGKYRLRMPDTLIDRVASWADRAHALLILDVQIGRSTVQEELAPLVKYLQRPTVHLALDPEFALPPGKVPGRVIGRMDAAQVNEASAMLASLVDDNHLPPKVLIVHRFTHPMLREADQIHLDPRVQVVIDMDGFGPDWMKRSSYRAYVASDPVQYAGFKLFYKNDKPVMTPRDVLGLFPAPSFVMFQ